MLASEIKNTVYIGSDQRMTLQDCMLISKNKISVELANVSRLKMQKSYDFLYEKINKRLPVYGVNTQFGDQVNILDSYLNDESDLYYQSITNRQENLVLSHCCGLGNRVSIETVRVAMALRAHCLSQGFSGVSIQAVETLLSFLKKDVIPVVRRYGSIGASGDLIPLASIATAFMGGPTDVYYQKKIMPANEAIKKAGLNKISLKMRDGIALINGTSFMTAIASLAINKLNFLFKQMLTAIALALESMLVIHSAYHPLVHQLKNHRGEMEVNDYLLECWAGSKLLTNLDEIRVDNMNDRPLQDCYSLRSVAQGFGPFYENLEDAIIWIENEMNSVNDNPIIDVENKSIHHGANFMGYYVTDACDILKMNIAQASTWIHALLANMVHPRKSFGLPTSLVSNPEKFNGFRPLQLLAASIAVQNRKLAQSQQSYMLPTEGDNQDVNSLGTHAAFDFEESVYNLERLNAILLIASVQALEFRGLQNASIKARKISKNIRQFFPEISSCRPLIDELEQVINFVRTKGI